MQGSLLVTLTIDLIKIAVDSCPIYRNPGFA